MLEPTSPTRRSPREGAFTLIELLIVLGILAVLVAVVLPSVSGFLGRGQEEALNTDTRTIQTAVDGYYTDRTLRFQGVFLFPTELGESFTGGPRQHSGIFTSNSSTFAMVTFDWLVNEGYLRTIPQSASNFNRCRTPLAGCQFATYSDSPGSYSWVIRGSDGRVFACFSPTPAPSTFASGDNAITGCSGAVGPSAENGFGFAGAYP